MNNKYFPLLLLIVLLILPSLNYARQVQQQYLNFTTEDTIKERPVQYRRGIELQHGYQSYEEKYAGKNLDEEKRRLFPLQSTGVWTELNPKVPRVDYLGINFVNKDTGWAVGDLGALIKSTDGGISWTVIETNTTTPILKVRSFDGQVVLASGFGGMILRSTDGGETFAQVASNVTGDLWGLQMINDTLGWACGNANSLTKTTDGGQTWQRIFTPGYTSDYWWIDFINLNYIFIAANGKVLKTIDGGQNWEIIQAGDSYPLFSIDVIDSTNIAAAGYGGTGYSAKNIYSSDGGNNWINGGSLTMESVNCIKYVNPDTGYVIMNNVIGKKTTNRGQEWTGIALGGEYEMQFFGGENLGYSAGTELRIYKSENGYENWQRLIINDNFSDVFFISEQKGFAISSSAFSAPSGLYKTTDGGLNWQKYPSGINGTDLLFTDSLTGFIAGTPFRIWKTTDSGISWYITNITGLSDTLGTINKIFFINQSTGWAVTSRGGILKTTDGGDNWFAQLNVGVSIGFNSIYFVDSLYGWTANSDRPFKTTDGGTNWIQQTNINIWNSDDVYFPTVDSGWIGRYSSINNSLFKTTDGGLNWIAIPEVIGARKFYYFPDPIHWITIGFSRYYLTNDYGNNWIEFTEDVPTGLVSFYAPTNILGYAVGSLGLVLGYNDTTYVPVELISFEGRVKDHQIVLSWTTASEINNKGFEVQRLNDDKDWLDIGFVSGNGTSTKPHHYSFTDESLQSGVYQYRLKQIDFDGSFKYSKIVEVIVGLPTEYSLSQNYPNPFNPNTKIKYTIPSVTLRQAQSDKPVRLVVYDVLGNEIATLVNEEKQPGIYEVELNGNNFTSGVYFCQLRAENYIQTIKMLLLK